MSLPISILHTHPLTLEYELGMIVQSQLNLAVLNTIGHNYENRSTTTQFERVEIARSSLAHIQALRGEYAKWKSANSNTE